MYLSCSAWMAMSDACPCIPAEGWCIMIRAWGSANRLPREPAHNRNCPIEAPRPMQIVPTSGETNCIVS